MAGQFDKWVSKIVAVLKRRGFVQAKKRATGHRKFVFEGKPLKRKCVINIQSKAHEKSRADILKGIIRDFKAAGAPKDWIAEIDQIALGMMYAQPTDTIVDIEEKLLAALEERDLKLVASLGISLGELAGRQGVANYSSSAIAAYIAQEDDKAKKSALMIEIEERLLQQFKWAIESHIAQNGSFEIGYGFRGTRYNIEFDDEVKKEFGFEIRYFEGGRGQEFYLHGNIVSKLADLLKAISRSPHLTVKLTDNCGEAYCVYYDAEEAWDLSLYPINYEASLDVFEDVVKKLRDNQLLLQLKLEKLKEA